MVHFADTSDEERFARIEHKATETRKMLLGALMLTKDAWKDELMRREEGRVIMGTIEKAEEAFAKRSEPDRLKRLDHALDVINKRAKSILDLMAYISKYGGYTYQ
jgi:hypothetical protein